MIQSDAIFIFLFNLIDAFVIEFPQIFLNHYSVYLLKVNILKKEQVTAVEENLVEEHNVEHHLKKATVSVDREDKLVQLPIARVKRIMKMDPDVNSATQEAVFLIAKSTVSYFACKSFLMLFLHYYLKVS